MQVFSDYSKVRVPQGTVVAIGNFDGVHLGHQALIQAAVDRATTKNMAPCVLTFDPHPVRLFAPNVQMHELTSLSEKVRLLESYGIEVVLAQGFDRVFASLTESDFVRKVLLAGLNAGAVVVGYDFRFGAGRTGTLDSLRTYGADLGFEVIVVDAVESPDGVPVSSTRIRTAVESGLLADVRKLVDRPLHLHGTVVPGEQRGRSIGFRTANVQPDVGISVPAGVYAGWLDYGDGPRDAVANIGRNPTFGDDRPMTVEVHILDHDAPNLYGRNVRFWFADSIREERRFASIDQLVTQINADCRSAAQILEGLDPPPVLAWN